MAEQQSPVRVGVVGLGGMGRHHASLLDDLGANVVGGADIDPAARAAFADDFGAEPYDSHESMYAQETVDAVVVATPNALHEPAAVDAFEREINVFLEKPLANTLKSAQRIADAAEASDAFGMVGFHNRFLEAATALKAYIQDGQLGDITHVETNYIRRRGIPGRGTWFTDEELSGGGAMIDVGVHILDLTLHLLDFPEVSNVTANTRDDFGDREDYSYLHMWGDDAEDLSFDVEDSVTAYLQTKAGYAISLDVAWATNREPEEVIRIRGTEAGAALDKSDGSATIRETADLGTAHHRNTRLETKSRDLKVAEMETFVDAVDRGTPPKLNTIDQALDVQRIIDAIYRSAADSGNSVTIEPTAPRTTLPTD